MAPKITSALENGLVLCSTTPTLILYKYRDLYACCKVNNDNIMLVTQCEIPKMDFKMAASYTIVVICVLYMYHTYAVKITIAVYGQQYHHI